jgi:hypothetical protein
MPPGIDPADRKLLLIAGAVFLLMLSVFFFVPPEAGPDSGIPSTYSSTAGGARAAYLLLDELKYSVRRWEQPPSELPQNAAGALLILAGPQMAPAPPERAALLQFVERGGVVLFTGALLENFFTGAKLKVEPFPGEVEEFSAQPPSRYSRTAPQIALRPQARWTKLQEGQSGLYGEPGGSVVVSWRHGAGRVIWWAAATPLTNAGITRADNLNLFLETLRESSAQNRPPQIYWDEYFHGQRNSLWAFFAKTPLPMGLLQIALVILAVFFTFSRRSGPVVKPAAVSRLAPLEFVDTLGALYQRAGAAPAAVSVAYQKFRGLLTRQLRLSPAIADNRLAQAAGERLGQKPQAIAEVLQRAEAAGRAAKLAPARALEIVRELEALEHKIGLTKRTTQERS